MALNDQQCMDLSTLGGHAKRKGWVEFISVQTYTCEKLESECNIRVFQIDSDQTSLTPEPLQ